MSGVDTDPESQGLVLVKGMHWHTEQIWDGRKSVSDVTKERLRVESVILS